MSRTPLFAAVQKALARSLRDSSVVWPQSSALTRRKLLRLSAAAAGAAALSPVFEWSAYAKKKKRHGKHGPYSIAIIGGGVAGLTAAYRLQAAGAKPVVFEASNRWGGRMFTVYDFYKGMFCELGGEFVDTNHEDLQKLGAELGVEMQKLAAEGDGEDLYFFRGAWKTPKDMLDPAKQTGAFVPIAKQIAEDAGKLTDKDDNWTAHATKLDEMSLKAYLEQFRGKTDDWAIDLLDVAYNIEFGLETEDQSSLNMVDFIGSDLSKPFQMFGESDEVYRIKGGSSALIKALLAALENKVDMQAWAAAFGARHQGRPDRRELRRARGHALGNLRCRDPRFAVHPSAAGQGFGGSAARGGKAEDNSRAWLRVECQDFARHHLARVAES